jgi:diacylglycerol kinase (ATP)
VARWSVFVNGAAGRRSVQPEHVRAVLAAAGVDAILRAPRSAAEMRVAIGEAATQGVTHFAVAGGDGTVNLAINSLLTLDLGFRPVIGVLPVGTGCDLLRTFGLPQDMVEAAKHLVGNDVYPVDVATLEGAWGLRYFINVAQTGVGAAAVQTSARLGRRLGSSRYPLAFLTRLPLFPPARVRIITEKRTFESEALAVILANGQFFAGGWNVAPKATLVDGVLDVQVINCPKTRAPALVPKLIKGTHLRDPAVRRFSASEFEIVSEPEWPVECDGDLIGNTTMRGRVVPAAISLKV